VGEQADLGWHSHSLAWCSGDLYVMSNAWWEPLTFEVQQPGEWRLALASVTPETSGLTWTLAPRSIVVLER
jgi:pullulanase/glycogen debranching enzyme